MSNTATNVSAAKPKVSGGIWRAPIGTTLPTDAVTALNEAFKCLGYVSEDGVTNSNSPESESVKAWGGDEVLTTQTEKKDTYKYKLIECLNLDVMKAVHGSDNVTGTLADGLTVKSNAKEQEDACWVIEMILRGGILQRIVIPDGKISEIGDIVYKDDTPIAYDLTVSAMPDAAGNTAYKYFKSAA